ncbi:MAG TPA: triphosphoribosyl-dephospho-CoA synthase [Vicinamibacterales bacterium]|nr:triphosphoribosyl-dephospho-CoA synthase [Vicinamibacterales bacterium]
MSTAAVVSPAEVAAAAQMACLLEVSAPKPGNVSPGRHFGDLRFEDFLASAVAIGEPLAGAGTRGLGATVRLAVEATARWTRSNTNLGIILLLTPLARAAMMTPGPSDDSAGEDLRSRVRRVLEATTVDDARDVYVAIRRATPGGMGVVQSQDLSAEPTETLLDVMRLAVTRDTVAGEYATGFEVTFGVAVPALERARGDGLPWDDAVVETFLTVLASIPDTHISRRSGAALAAQVSARARSALAAGGVRSAAGRVTIDEMDAALRDARNSGNPGTTADLTAAAIFVTLIAGGWESRSA